MFLQLKPEENAIPVATLLLQLAIYGHKKDVENSDKFWNMCEDTLIDTMKALRHDLPGIIIKDWTRGLLRS